MNKEKRKALQEAYQNRIPEMGIIALRVVGERVFFVNKSRDIKADFNSNMAKLGFNAHPNKELQGFYNTQGKESILTEIIEQIEVKDPTEDYTDKLEGLLETFMELNPDAKKIWR